jgi:phosphoribosylformylglycinamidine synthase
LAEEHHVPVEWIGYTGEDNIMIGDLGGVATVPLADLRAAHEGFFPRLMGSELTPEF